MQKTGQLHNKEVLVYRTVLLAHSCEGHLQYLGSLEADLANAAKDKGEIAASEESVSASTVDTSKEPECEAGADCECLQWGSNTRHCSQYTLGNGTNRTSRQISYITAGFLTDTISGIYPISGHPISGFSRYRVLRTRYLSRDILYVPISGVFLYRVLWYLILIPISGVTRYRDIKTRYWLSNIRYRDQYRVQYRVSRYRHVQNTEIGFNIWVQYLVSRYQHVQTANVGFNIGFNIGYPDIGVK
jgi:hypothetical protein